VPEPRSVRKTAGRTFRKFVHSQVKSDHLCEPASQ
jgi:hypothetical protein